MKKVITLVLVTILLFSSVSCRNISPSDAKNESKQGTLIVDGQTVQSCPTLYPEYTTLSLCDVLSALGFELSWNGADRASFYCDGTKYELCVSEKTLVREGSNDNYLICAPGNTHYVCNIDNGGLIIDDNTLYALFSTYINRPIDIAVEQENNCVVITSK